MLRSLMWRTARLLGSPSRSPSSSSPGCSSGGPGRALRGHAGIAIRPSPRNRASLTAARRRPRRSLPERRRRVAGPRAGARRRLLRSRSACCVSVRRVRRRYVRLRVEPYRADHAERRGGRWRMYAALHKRCCSAGGGDCCGGSPRSRSRSTTRRGRDGRPAEAWMAGCSLLRRPRAIVEAALRSAYPNCRLVPSAHRSATRRRSSAPEEARRVHQARRSGSMRFERRDAEPFDERV